MVLISIFISLLIYDDLGKKLEIRAPPEKAVSLAPNITDFLIYLDLEEKIIGRTYLDKAKGEVVINESGFLSREKILALKPDIVFAGDINSMEDVEWMRKKEIMVFYLKTQKISDISSAFIKIGKIFGKEEYAIFKLKEFLDSIFKEKVSPKGYALVIIDSKGGIWSAGKNTFLDEILKISGFKNFAEFFEGYKMVSPEMIDFKKIKYFILAHPGIENDLREYQFYEKIKDKIYIIKNYEYFTRPSPFIYRALSELRKIK